MPLNIPNFLTLSRVLAAPMVAFLYLLLPRPAADIAAFALFAAAAATDYVDGALARRWGQVSAFGRMLDPIADKAMIAVSGGLLMALYDLRAEVVAPVVVILTRETLVSGLREFLKGARVLDVTLMAKWKTTVQMIAFAALLLAGAAPWAELPGLALLWAAAALTAITGWDYFAKGLAYIQAEERREGSER